MSDTENNLFVLPIEFLNYKQKIFKNLDEDLELLSTHDKDSENVPVYNKIFNPQTECGNNMLERLAKHYTTDTTFLSDTQKLHSSINDIKQNSDTVNSSYRCWKELKNTDNFCEKYYYLEWDRLKWLNNSPAFMSFLSFYNISSPVLNLLAPLTLLVVPFFMLKLMKVKVTFENYKEALFAALKNHAIGKLFYSFNQVQLSQKIYFSAMIGLYFYNIYQNIVVCYRFYKNLQHISNNFKQFKNYFEETINKIDYICSKCESLSSYNMFCKHLQDYKLRIIERLKQLEMISNKTMSVNNLVNMGRIMSVYYDLYCGNDTEDLFEFTFQFNGYFDTLCGLNENIVSNKINKAEYLDKKTAYCSIKNVYHPCVVGDVITNNVKLKNNIILTGPNAAGKTTLLKSTIVNILLAQQIGYGYFSKAAITPFDYIHCYINIPDTSSRDSLFQAEARRCKNILDVVKNNPNKKHFCIFDELYSGTNPHEAISSAFSYLTFLCKNKNTKFILTTHFNRLCNLLEKNKSIKNLHMHTEIRDNIPIYKYKLAKGISKTKGGICVLEQLNYPKEILIQATQTLNNI